MAQKKQVFKVTKLKLSNFVTNPTDRMDLESRFMEFETERQIAVEKHRRAVQAQTEAQQAQLNMQRLHQGLLLKAAEFSTEIGSEPIWYIFRKDGEIVFESPYGQRTQRNLIRAEMSQLDARVNESSEANDDDLYESGGEEESSGAAN
jgi:hypothetical protein